MFVRLNSLMSHTTAFDAREIGRQDRPWTSLVVSVATLALIAMGLANIAARVTWREVEDGVLWTASADGVVASAVTPQGPGGRAGLSVGDVLLSLNGQAVREPAEVVSLHHASEPGARARYAVLRPGAREVLTVTLDTVPAGRVAVYYCLAGVGLFSLLVGAAVRFRRPQDPATLHFYWLTVAFFGVFAFSFSGRLDRLDWAFYWADRVSLLLLPPIFLHFALVFPLSPGWFRVAQWRALFHVSYVPAFILGGLLMFTMAAGPGADANFDRHLAWLGRALYLHLAAYLVIGVGVFVTGLLGEQTPTARRQLRWIGWGSALGGLPFAAGHAIPLALGFTAAPWTELLALPLGLAPVTYACAIARYRLMDVEVIVKRSLVYVAAVAVIVAVYAALLQAADRVHAGGATAHEWLTAVGAALVAVLLAPPIKAAAQAAFERAFYRGRLDYRRALVGFARDLNSDLDLKRLAGRLVTRVSETLQVDRMALMLLSDDGGSLAAFHEEGAAAQESPVSLSLDSSMGRALAAGQVISLDDPVAVARFPVEDIDAWRDCGLYYFVPCVAADGITAALALGQRESAELLSSEDLTLLVTVAGQIATALENARLYRQLQTKAAEMDRLREFNEGIVESLDSGLCVLDLD